MSYGISYETINYIVLYKTNKIGVGILPITYFFLFKLINIIKFNFLFAFI